MDRRQFGAAAFAIAATAATGAAAAKPPETWDGLVRVKSKRFQLVYLAPGADFRGYKRVMLDPTEVAFEKNWKREYNNTTIGLSQRVSDKEIEEVVAKGIVAATDIFTEAWTEGGYPVVQEPDADVLRVRTGILNIRVSAPERQMAGRNYSFSNEAGSASLVVEVRDSVSGAIMGRAVDGEVAGDTTVGWRNRVTNRADFRQMVKRWAKHGVEGLGILKGLSPINEAGLPQK